MHFTVLKTTKLITFAFVLYSFLIQRELHLQKFTSLYRNPSGIVPLLIKLIGELYNENASIRHRLNTNGSIYWQL